MLSRKLAILVTLFATATACAEDPKPKLLPEFLVQKCSIRSIAFSSDGGLLAVAGGQFEDRRRDQAAAGELTVWDLKARKKLMTFVGHKSWISAVVFSPDGKMIASASEDKTVRLWDVSNGKQLAVLHDSDWIMSLAFSPDGATLAGADWSTEGNEQEWGDFRGTVFLWDVKERKVRKRLEGHSGVVHRVVFSPDGKTLAAATGVWDKNAGEFQGWYQTGEIKLWNPMTGTEQKTLTAHKGGRINTLAFSPDGKTLASGCVVRSGESFNTRRGEVTLWEVTTGKAKLTADINKAGVQALAFSHDGKLLAAASEMQVKSLDDFTSEIAILDSKTLKTLTKLTELDDPWSLAFSPVQRVLASPDDRKVKLWEIPERP